MVKEKLPRRPVSDLSVMLATLTPVLQSGVFVFATASDLTAEDAPHIVSSMREEEGLSVIAAEEHAARRGWPVALQVAWLTLKVHSDLNAVGLTAAVSRVLAAQGIACNIVAGVCHDHVFVPYAQRSAALQALRCLQSDATLA